MYLHLVPLLRVLYVVKLGLGIWIWSSVCVLLFRDDPPMLDDGLTDDSTLIM